MPSNGPIGKIPFRIKPSKFLLKDEFLDAKTAGAINSTLAVPGPGGARTVNDIENVMFLSSGTLTLGNQAASPVFGEERILWPAQTRRVGQVLLFHNVNAASMGAQGAWMGWSESNAPTSLFENKFRLVSVNTLQVRDAAGTIETITPLVTTGTNYDFALVTESIASYLLIRGGVFPYWSLAWRGVTGSFATPFPALSGFDQNESIDSVLIPKELYKIYPSLSDSFNRANGALGSTDGSGDAYAVGGNGYAWNPIVGTWAISNNVAGASALATGTAMAVLDLFSPDVIVEADVTQITGSVGFVLRFVDVNNYITVYHDGTNIKMDQMVGGTLTNTFTQATALIVGGKLRVAIDRYNYAIAYGPTQASVKTGVQIGSVLQNGTMLGLYTTNLNNTFDKFVAWRKRGYEYLNSFFTRDVLPTMLFPYGDSKTFGTGDTVVDGTTGYPPLLMASLPIASKWLEYPQRIGRGGYTVAQMKDLIDRDLLGLYGNPSYILINLGTNEAAAGQPSINGATWQTNLGYILDAMHAKWSSARLGVAKIYRTSDNGDLTTMDDTWIPAVVNARLSFAFIGPDERAFLPGNMSDASHPNHAGYVLTASNWKTAMGL